MKPDEPYTPKEAIELGLDPIRLDGPDGRLTAEQFELLRETYETEGWLPIPLGFNEAGWLVCRLFISGDDEGQLMSIPPDGHDIYFGRDAHLRKFQWQDD